MLPLAAALHMPAVAPLPAVRTHTSCARDTPPSMVVHAAAAIMHGALGAHAFAGHAAAVQAATGGAAAAVVAAAGASSASKERPPPGPRVQAVLRLLNVEYARFRDVATQQWSLLVKGVNVEEAELLYAEEAREMVRERLPIVHWSVVQLLHDRLGTQKFGVWCPTLKRWNLHPWQWVPNAHPHSEVWNGPTLGKALSALRQTLVQEVRHGLRTSPLRVVRLAYRAAFVYVLSFLNRLPGPHRRLIQREWPRLIEHLSGMLERNQADAKGKLDEEHMRFASVRKLRKRLLTHWRWRTPRASAVARSKLPAALSWL